MNSYRHENKVIINYALDLFSKGLSIQQIADQMNTKVWCIQHLFVLDAQKEPS